MAKQFTLGQCMQNNRKKILEEKNDVLLEVQEQNLKIQIFRIFRHRLYLAVHNLC